jgi:integrase
MRGFGRTYTRGDVVWLEYWHRGRQHRQSTRLTGPAGERAAERVLKERLKEIGRGRHVGPKEDRFTFAELLDGLVTNYTNNGRRTSGDLVWRLAPLRQAFAGDRALDVTGDRIEGYKATRLAEGKAPATVNRELAALRRAFRLAVEQERLSSAPVIKLLAEDNAREGFLDPGDFEAVVGHLPGYLQDFGRYAYASGWRRGEVRTLEWADVDRAAGRVTLRREHSKSKEPRILSLTPTLAALIERRWQARQLTGPDGTVTLCQLVFHRAGRPVGDFRRAWATACKAAGVAGTLFHDLRRSCVRNLEKAGVSQAVAMKITGHKTASVYRRYRIVDEEDMREALGRVETAAAGQAERKVVAIAEARGAR